MFENKIEFINKVLTDTMKLNIGENKVYYSPDASLYSNGNVIIDCVVRSNVSDSFVENIMLMGEDTERYYNEIAEAKAKILRDEEIMLKNRRKELVKELAQIDGANNDK